MLTMFGAYFLAKLLYQGEQEASALSKSVTMFAVLAIVVILVVNWIMALGSTNPLDRIFR